MSTATPVQSGLLLAVERVSKAYPRRGGDPHLVLQDVDLSVRDGEILALLGRSGSGKSTLLRIIVGLVAPSSGAVRYRGAVVRGPVPQFSMVFQSFALFPWLTVLQNVELGLEAAGVDPQTRRRRALEAIDMIGLDGFESAYPRELSGGMRQRVGVARALVVEPELLLMDEPFSALDVLTADTLRSDLLHLWEGGRMKTRGIIVVSHNIEEAVLLADRIVVLGSDPGRIVANLDVSLKRPRDRDSAGFRLVVDHVYGLMTRRDVPPPISHVPDIRHGGLAYPLPSAQVGQIAGILETLAGDPFRGRADLPDLAGEVALPLIQLFELLEALEVLGFAHVTRGDIEITPVGRSFVAADILQRKEIFAAQLVERVPLAVHIRETLEAQPTGSTPANDFLQLLEGIVDEAESRRILATVIEWGRYAELFAFDDSSDQLSLENPGAEQPAARHEPGGPQA
jgi:NitT/TauT family transport system ATP-binding protein